MHPDLAKVLLKKGAAWKRCKPTHVNHSEDSTVRSAGPAHYMVKADVLLVHRGHTYEQKSVWFYVYEGSMRDCMLSKHLLSTIQSASATGHKLVDLDAGEGDDQRVQQLVQDMRQLEKQVFVRAAEAWAGAGKRPTMDAKSPRLQDLLKEMHEQRQRLRERVGKPYSAEAVRAAMEVLDRFPDNFRPPGREPCRLGVYRITLKDKSKFHIAMPRRVNPIVLTDMRKQVQELVDSGVIERCTSRPNSVYAVVMAKKPGKPGQFRMCQDMRELNDNTVPAPYLTPNVAESLDKISGKKLYCSFDFSSWFHQFELAEEDRDKVAFIIPGDEVTAPQIYRFKRVCFGLLNATWFTQRQLQEALEQAEGCEGIYPFVDDVVLAADSVDEMVRKLEAFMRFCQDKNIKLKREKCVLATSAVKHLGFIVGEDGKHLDPARVESLMSITAPKNLKGLKSLLGSFSFVRAWVAGMADIAAPLTNLMGETAKRLGFKWGPEEEDALAALKIAVGIAPQTMEPNYSSPFHISVDASDVGVGAVLWQWRQTADGKMAPCAIAHASRRFSVRESKWQISEREMYSWKYAFECFESMIRGHPDVTLHTDHLNLVTGLWSHCSPKIERWRLYLEQWKPFKIVHVKGTAGEQAVADGLSRLHAKNLTEFAPLELEDEEARLAAELGEGGNDERLFCNYSMLNAWRSLSERSPVEEASARCAAFELEDIEELGDWEEEEEEVRGVFAAPAPLAETQQDRVASQLREGAAFPHRRLLELAHDGTHPSITTTWKRVQQMLGFPYGKEGQELKDEVKRWGEACITCQKLQPCRERLNARIGSIRQRPFTCYSFDCITLTEPSEQGHRYILVIIDSFSRAVELFPLVRATADEVASGLHDVFCRWGRPHEVRCDNAKSFLSATITSLLKLARIKQHLTPAYSHQSNGQVENMNRRVMSVLRAMVLDSRLGPQSKSKWNMLLPAVRRVIMTRLVTALGCTPNELAYCFAPDTESSIFDTEIQEELANSAQVPAESGSEKSMLELRRQHEVLVQACDSKQEEILEKLKTFNQELLQDAVLLQPGDFVLLDMRERPHGKLQAPWGGPYQVIDHARDDEAGPIFRCQHLASKKVSEFHVSMLKKCNMDRFESSEDAVPYAAMDSWEWEVEKVTAHFPAGPRKAKGKKIRPKKGYEFEVWWKGCPPGEDNPTLESWEQNSSLRTCQPYLDYLARPEVKAELGADFAIEQPGDL